jgi:hypothetical protein
VLSLKAGHKKSDLKVEYHGEIEIEWFDRKKSEAEKSSGRVPLKELKIEAFKTLRILYIYYYYTKHSQDFSECLKIKCKCVRTFYPITLEF